MLAWVLAVSMCLFVHLCERVSVTWQYCIKTTAWVGLIFCIQVCLAHTILRFREIIVSSSSKIKVLPSGTCPKLWPLKI